MLESWKSEVSQPDVAPSKEVHWVMEARDVVRFVTVKSRKAVMAARSEEEIMSISDRLNDEGWVRVLTQITGESQASSTTYIKYQDLHLKSI